jgi:hypothetical protein
MKKFLLLFIAFTTLTTVSYASFPVSETTNVQVIEKSETSTTNNIEFVESETNEVSNSDLSGIFDLHWSLRILIGLALGFVLFILIDPSGGADLF